MNNNNYIGSHFLGHNLRKKEKKMTFSQKKSIQDSEEPKKIPREDLLLPFQQTSYQEPQLNTHHLHSQNDVSNYGDTKFEEPYGSIGISVIKSQNAKKLPKDLKPRNTFHMDQKSYKFFMGKREYPNIKTDEKVFQDDLLPKSRGIRHFLNNSPMDEDQASLKLHNIIDMEFEEQNPKSIFIRINENTS